jgi:hypothetical protein
MKTAEQTRVGRPSAEVKIPKGKFTFQQLCEANSHLAPLTLRNFMSRDTAEGKHSQIIRVEDERGEPGSDAGYGRKPFLYVRRELMKSNGLSVRNIGYHVHKAKAPSHTMKRTEKASSRPHIHKIIDFTKGAANGATITISFAPVPKGAPVPTSVTVNFNRKNSSEMVTVDSPQHEKITHSSTDHPTETSESTPATPPPTPTAEAA